jgi:hypothetical protein
VVTIFPRAFVGVAERMVSTTLVAPNPANPPVKQAAEIQNFHVGADDPMQSSASDTIFSDTYRRTGRRRMRVGPSNAENPAKDDKTT